VSGTFAIVNPPELGTPRGFAHGLIAPGGGRLLFVAGQIAGDATLKSHHRGHTGFAQQFDDALARVLAVVQAGGGRPEQIARMTVYVTDIDAYRESRPALRDLWLRHMGSYYPAMALVAVTALVDERAMVEIEATAVLS
jgi:enamine deaminase RidA (YjgF/YER057c/UK114 family)